MVREKGHFFLIWGKMFRERYLHKIGRFVAYKHWLTYYTRKNACSVTACNSTDIRSVQDNVATPVTAMMVTVCISTDALSVFISPDSSDTNSYHQCCWSIMPVTACPCSYRLQQSVPNIPVSFCYIRLIQPWQPNRLFQFDTVSSEQSVGDNSLIQLWYIDIISVSGLNVQQAVTGLWRFCVCRYLQFSINSPSSYRRSFISFDVQHRLKTVCNQNENTRDFKLF